jgi:hypothetical protein
MHDGVEAMPAEYLVKDRVIGEIANDELTTQDGVSVSRGQVVEHDRVMPAVGQHLDHV